MSVIEIAQAAAKRKKRKKAARKKCRTVKKRVKRPRRQEARLHDAQEAQEGRRPQAGPVARRAARDDSDRAAARPAAEPPGRR